MTGMALDPRLMSGEQLGLVQESVRLSYDIELPEMPNWNSEPCSRHGERDLPAPGCRRCGVRPRRHQRIGITWLYLTRYAGLFDSTGLGKTVQCAGLLAMLQLNGELGIDPPCRRALIICRAATITQWRDELARMVPGLATLCVTGDLRERAAKLAGYPWEVALAGPEMLVSKVTKGADQIAQFDIGTVICDDIEALKNANKTSRTIRGICAGADRVVVATATPLDKRLTQLYDLGADLLKWRQVLGKRDEFQHRYVQLEQVWYTPKLKPVRCRFCKAVMIADHGRKMWLESKSKAPGPCPQRAGMKNDQHFPLSRQEPGPKFQWVEKGANPLRVGELADRIAPLVLRRTAAGADDVDMPEVVPSRVWLELGAEQAKRYEEIRRGVLETMKGGRVTKSQAENWWLRAWQITSSLACLDEGRTGQSAKLERVVADLDGDLSGEPVVVYCYFRPTLADLSGRLDKLGIANVRIWGEQHAAEQDSAIATFNSGAVNVMLITDAGGMGLNLQRARRLLVVDTPRSAGRMQQIVGRIKRDGSEHKTCYVTQYLSDTPLDRALSEMVTGEAIMAASVLDGGRLGEFAWAGEPDRIMAAITG